MVAEMFSKMTENTVCFFDEVFSSTDNTGAMELSDNVLRALATRGIRTIARKYGLTYEALTGIPVESIETKYGNA